MIDWFALITPLAALPIVALLAFVGCQLIFPVDPYGQDIATVALNFSALEIASTPTVIALVVSGEAYVDRHDDIFHDTDFPFTHTKALTDSDLAAGKATIDINGPIKVEEEAWVSCECQITLSDGTTLTEPKSGPLRHDKPEDSDQPIDFFLLRTGPNTFTLS
jgi:hypothetical protein